MSSRSSSRLRIALSCSGCGELFERARQVTASAGNGRAAGSVVPVRRREHAGRRRPRGSPTNSSSMSRRSSRTTTSRHQAATGLRGPDRQRRQDPVRSGPPALAAVHAEPLTTPPGTMSAAPPRSMNPTSPPSSIPHRWRRCAGKLVWPRWETLALLVAVTSCIVTSALLQSDTRAVLSLRGCSRWTENGTLVDMPRAIWSGSISFGLVNIPIKLYAAVVPEDGQLQPARREDRQPHQVQEGLGRRR